MTKRNKRRRSRQCKGTRRRNMLRAAERSLAAGAHYPEQEAIVSEARAAGAIPTPIAEEPGQLQEVDEETHYWYGDGEEWA